MQKGIKIMKQLEDLFSDFNEIFSSNGEYYKYLKAVQAERPLNHSESYDMMILESEIENGICPDCGDSEECPVCYKED
jgi:hypothetical protein